jgi:adenylate cyclase
MKFKLIGGLIKIGILAILLFIVNSPLQNKTYLFDNFDLPLQDFLCKVRLSLTKDKIISDQITLSGIDDKTNKVMGRYGGGDWKLRIPFIKQLEVFEQFKPASVVYDIEFLNPLTTETIAETAAALQNAGLIAKVNSLINTFVTNGEIEGLDEEAVTIKTLSRIIDLIADSAMPVKLMKLQSNETPVLLAYHFSLGSKKINKWTTAEVLGELIPGEEIDEDNGTTMPYLRDVSIPTECITNLTDDFKFIQSRAVLPSTNLLDFGELGYVNVPRDADGVVRRVPMFIGMEYSFMHPVEGQQTRRMLMPSIALLTVLKAYKIPSGDIQDDPGLMQITLGESIRLKLPDNTVKVIPIDKNGLLFLNYVGKTTDYRSMSFSDAMEFPQAMPEYMTDKIVFVATTATGTSGSAGLDIGPTPVSQNAPFVLAHMTAVNNVLMDNYIRPLTPIEVTKILLMLGSLLILLNLFTSFKVNYYAFVIILISYLGAIYFYYHNHISMLPITAPLSLAFSYLIVSMAIYYSTEQKEKKKVRGMFSTMVSDNVLTYMESNAGSFSLSGEMREASILFSDVAGFTTISESLTPEQLVGLLNDYLTPMTEIVLNTSGYLDKYEGDAIMAVWGVPFPDVNHAKDACWGALAQQEKLCEIRDELEEKYGYRLTVRIGLNSGNVSAGNMGSKRRFSYTVMGDAVNLAARLEPASKDYGTEILIGQNTYDMAKEHIEVRLIDKLIVKGKTVPILIYELIARKGEISEEKIKLRDLYEKALKIHWERKFDEASEILEGILKGQEDTASSNLLKRIGTYRDKPPGESWKGEFIRLTKD